MQYGVGPMYVIREQHIIDLYLNIVGTWLGIKWFNSNVSKDLKDIVISPTTINVLNLHITYIYFINYHRTKNYIL